MGIIKNTNKNICGMLPGATLDAASCDGVTEKVSDNNDAWIEVDCGSGRDDVC